MQLENTIAEVMKKMGMNFSEPIPNFGEDLGYLAVVVRCRDRIRLLHAPKCVVETVQLRVKKHLSRQRRLYTYGNCSGDAEYSLQLDGAIDLEAHSKGNTRATVRQFKCNRTGHINAIKQANVLKVYLR